MQVAHHGTLHLDGTGYLWYPVAVLAIVCGVYIDRNFLLIRCLSVQSMLNRVYTVQLWVVPCVSLSVSQRRLRDYDVVISVGVKTITR